MNVADMDGTDQEKLRLKRYRKYRSKVGVVGRIAELCRLRPFDKPPEEFLSSNEAKD
jgi:hypothetical protein